MEGSLDLQGEMRQKEQPETIEEVSVRDYGEGRMWKGETQTEKEGRRRRREEAGKKEGRKKKGERERNWRGTRSGTKRLKN